MRAAAASGDRRSTHYLDDRPVQGLRPACTPLLRCSRVYDAPDAPRFVVGYVEGAIRALRDARGTMGRPIGLLDRTRETVREHLVARRIHGLSTGKGDEHHVVSFLWTGCAVPRPVIRDEGSVLVATGE